VGVATFQPWHGAWRSLDELQDAFSESPSAPDPRFGTDERVADMLRSAGFSAVRTQLASYDVVFDGVDQWRMWSWATPMGGLWRRTPESAHPEILRRATAILERSRRSDGRLVLEVGARYTYGVA
jgi:hypothetical protein